MADFYFNFHSCNWDYKFIVNPQDWLNIYSENEIDSNNTMYIDNNQTFDVSSPNQTNSSTYSVGDVEIVNSSSLNDVI